MTTNLLAITVQRFTKVMAETDPQFGGATVNIEPYSGGAIELGLTITYKDKGPVTIVADESEIVSFMNLKMTGEL